MEKLHDLLRDITELTTNIETNYPELYKFLGENPITLPHNSEPDLEEGVFKDYLESLKQLLQHHLETHKASTAKHQ